MIRDLLALYEAVRTAQDGQEKADREGELDAAIRQDITRLFADPTHKEGRRSFKAIRKAIPASICDDDTLTETLYRMHYRPVPSNTRSGHDILWELRPPAEPAQQSGPPLPVAPPRTRRSWQSIAAIIGIPAAIVAVLQWIGVGPRELLELIGRSPGPDMTVQACMDAAPKTLMEISKCFREFQ